MLAGFATAGLESVDLASVALVDMTLADSVLPDMNLAGKEQHLAAGTNTPLPADRELPYECVFFLESQSCRRTRHS